jgi:predicted RNase H-like HicB family nuclease
MNIKKIIAATLLITAAGATFADDAAAMSAPAGKTRAEVIAELKQANAQGLIATNDADFSGSKPSVAGEKHDRVLAMPAPAGKTRAEVVAELKQANAQGLIATNDADFSGGKQFVSGQTHDRVLAQLKRADSKNN